MLDLTWIIRAVFQCIRQAGLKLTNEKCHFGNSWIPRQNHFIRGSITTNSQDSKFPKQVETPQIEKCFAALSGVGEILQNLSSQDGWKTQSILQILKSRSPNRHYLRIEKTSDSVNKALSDACELALKQPNPGRQLVLMTDKSFRSVGYALMIEDNPNQKKQSKRKTWAPVAFGSKTFSPTQLKLVIYSKEFLALYMAFFEFVHNLWEASKPTNALTDN